MADGLTAWSVAEAKGNMKRKIKDIADVRVGYQFRGKVRPRDRGNVRVIQIKDVHSDRKIHADTLTRVDVERPDAYLTRNGDVLFLTRGWRLYAVSVPEVGLDTIATAYFFIVRPKLEVVSSEFLAWTLNQPGVLEALRPYHRGTHMQLISRADLENLRVNVPPLRVQQDVLRLNELLEEEGRLCEAIQDRRTRLVHAICRKLIGEPSVDGDDNQPHL